MRRGKWKRNRPFSSKQIIYIFFILEIISLLLASLYLIHKTTSPNNKNIIHNNSQNTPLIRLIPLNANSSIFSVTKNIIKSSFDTYWNKCKNSDYIKPLTRQCINSSSISATVVESLDALYLSNLTKEYQNARNYVLNNISPYNSELISSYELGTKILGGFISIFSLTSDVEYLKKATELGDLLIKSFSGPIPYSFINGYTSSPISYTFGLGSFLSDTSGGLLELYSLSYLTSNKKYKNTIDNYLTCLSKNTDNLNYAEWTPGKCQFKGNYRGLSTLTSAFYANILRLHIAYPSPKTNAIVNAISKMLSERDMNKLLANTSTDYATFDESFCQLPFLLRSANCDDCRNAASNLDQECRRLRSGRVPVSGAPRGTRGDRSFTFDSSAAFEAAVSGDARWTEEDLDAMRCGGAVCAIRGSGHADIMPSAAISRWLKFIALNGQMPEGNYVVNDAGHFIPILTSL